MNENENEREGKGGGGGGKQRGTEREDVVGAPQNERDIIGGPAWRPCHREHAAKDLDCVLLPPTQALAESWEQGEH